MPFTTKKMYKKSIAIFLTVLFVAVVSAPTIISAIDDSVDISILYSCTEEEEKESEKNKTFELIFSECKNDNFSFGFSDGRSSLNYRFKNYPKPHLNLISPPPEFI